MINRQSAIENRKLKAFTLIELLVVIAIIALLVSILLPSLNRAKELARKVICLSNMRNIALASSLYANEYDGWIPVYWQFDKAASGTYKVYMGGWSHSGKLHRYGYLDDFKVLWCPSVSGGYGLEYNMDRTWIKAADGDYLIPEVACTLRSSYQYRGAFCYKENQPAATGSSGICIAMEMFRSSGSEYSWHGGGYNVVFIDGSADWHSDTDDVLLDYYNAPDLAPNYNKWSEHYDPSPSSNGWTEYRAVWAGLDRN